MVDHIESLVPSNARMSGVLKRCAFYAGKMRGLSACPSDVMPLCQLGYACRAFSSAPESATQPSKTSVDSKDAS